MISLKTLGFFRSFRVILTKMSRLLPRKRFPVDLSEILKELIEI